MGKKAVQKQCYHQKQIDLASCKASKEEGTILVKKRGGTLRSREKGKKGQNGNAK